MAENTAHLLSATVRALVEAGIRVWLFGGWAEELSGLRPPGPHQDIDLLYPAQDFDRVDEFIRLCNDAEEIRPKRFVHKRAFRWQGVMVELFLVQQGPGGCVTNFFGIHPWEWPEDAFSYTVPLLGGNTPSASPAALCLYRTRHGDVEHAYRQHAESDAA